MGNLYSAAFIVRDIYGELTELFDLSKSVFKFAVATLATEPIEKEAEDPIPISKIIDRTPDLLPDIKLLPSVK